MVRKIPRRKSMRPLGKGNSSAQSKRSGGKERAVEVGSPGVHVTPGPHLLRSSVSGLVLRKTGDPETNNTQ